MTESDAQTNEDMPPPDSMERAVEPSAPFPIVGVGASAGGLAAFEAFFSAMPDDMGMAFVLVQHLAPDHESTLVELLKRYTRMNVFEVEDGMRVLPNCVYVIPPNRDIALSNGALRLLDPVALRGHHLSIDFFFRSLAQQQRERGMCVILSGAGSDGTQGLRAIKAEGGMAIAQNPASAEYDSMPRSAIATGLIDYTLSPAEMPAQLLAYATRALGKPSPHAASPGPKTEDALKKILVLLRGHTGHDFSQYKQNTVNRRIERRMALQQLEKLEEYLRFVRETPAELQALFGDLLIGVTNFFRDPEAFEALQQQAAQLLAAKAVGSLVRVWTTGCSTGEEAYSLAILFREQMDAIKQSFKLQLFATDIDSRAIEVARAGLYPSSIAVDVSPDRLARFFTAEGSSYRVKKNLRDTLIFSEHDLIEDPPFSKLDLIVCRNLLIYMGPELQRKLIPLFHYALNPGGVLFLGSSETVGDFAELFTSLDRKAKLYQRLDSQGAARPMLATFLSRPGEPRSFGSAGRQELREPELPRTAELTLLKMADDALADDLTSALERAAAGNEIVSCRGLRIKTDRGASTVNLTVQPLRTGAAAASGSRLFLVAFEEPTGDTWVALDNVGTNPDRPTPEPASEPERRLAKLTQELRAKDEYLRSTQEQMQTAIEELRSSNEELQSTNEELQSANEELETSKEELQSVNEELATVNAELQAKVTDLSRANNDMNNLLAGTGVGTIFVDHDLCVQRFTPAAVQLVNLIRSDVGRPLGHIVSNLIGYDRLVSDVESVLETLTHKEVEVQTRAGAWYLLRIRPYRTLENVIEGAVITFTEITEQKRAQAVLLEHEAFRRMAAVMRDAHDAITVQDLDGRILAWNRRAEKLYGFSEAEALSMNIRTLIPEAQREAALALVRRLAQAEVLEPFRAQRIGKDSNLVEVSMTATALVNESGVVYAVFTTERELATDARTLATGAGN